MPELNVAEAKDQLVAIAESYQTMLGEIFERNPDAHLNTVRDLKVGLGLTWPKLAEKCYELFGIEGSDWDGRRTPDEWGIPGNQEVGWAMCYLTASARGEDPFSVEWT